MNTQVSRRARRDETLHSYITRSNKSPVETLDVSRGMDQWNTLGSVNTECQNQGYRMEPLRMPPHFAGARFIHGELVAHHFAALFADRVNARDRLT